MTGCTARVTTVAMNGALADEYPDEVAVWEARALECAEKVAVVRRWVGHDDARVADRPR